MTLYERISFFLLRALLVATRLAQGWLGAKAYRSQLALLRRFHLKPRPGDIYVATAPKAGTTWVQMIVYQLVTGGRGEFDHILQVSPFYEALMWLPDPARILDPAPSPRILKTHLSYEELQPPPDSKVIYVTRGLADSFASMYHHACLENRVMLDVEPFLGMFVAQKQGPWFNHLRSWWSHRRDPNVLHVRYEELSRDLEGQIRRIAAFCGLPIDEARLPEILERCGFQYMKQHDAKFDIRLGFYGKELPRGGFIRKGKVGGAGELLAPAQLARVDQAWEETRRELAIQDSEL